MNDEMQKTLNKYISPLTFAAKNIDMDSRIISRSGGVFVVISDAILNNDGVVYGCILDKNLHVKHIRTESSKNRDLMRGSKYVQSDIGEIYTLVKKDLEEGRDVLFSGTSCQIDALYGFINNRLIENLYTVDIVCHGVPSPGVFSDYIAWQESRSRSSCIDFNFRNKKAFGWKSHVETLAFNGGKKINSKIYTRLFYSHNILRPACYKCPYKSIIHPADITLADYWGIERIEPSFDDNKGVSLVLINNDKGKSLFEKCNDKLEYICTNIEESIQTPLIEPFSEPVERQKFWDEYRINSFEYIAKKYGKGGSQYFVYNILSFLRDYFKR